MKYKIENDIWEIKEVTTFEYIVTFNAARADFLCAGDTYETESGACWAICAYYEVKK